MTGVPTNPWLARLRPAGRPAVRLVCLAHAGGGGAPFRALADHLPEEIDLCAARLPGRESRRREPPVRRMDDVVRQLVAALGDTDLPLALYGHCSGALTAFEIARHLAAEGRPAPVRLFVSAFPAPAMVDRSRGVHRLPPGEFLEYVCGFGLVPEAILAQPDLFRLFEPGLRADFEVFETTPYRPAPPLEGPISVLGARDDPTVTVDELVGWRLETSDRFVLRLCPGDHSYFGSSPAAVAAAVVEDVLGGGR